jgi:holliday junction DNA helicase RuvA
MINHIEGKIVSLTPTDVVLDCNGMGYFLNISLNTYTAIAGKEKAILLVHVSVNQMDYTQVAYGFIAESERTLFRQLISVSGVGAASARMFLSSYSPEELVNHIVSGNVPALKKVKGIGDKSAQRIVVDLRDKMAKVNNLPQIFSGSNNKTREEALLALVMLGFVRNQAEKAVDKVLQQSNSQELSVEEIIKQALKTL